MTTTKTENGDAVAEISWPTVQSGGGGPPVEMSVVPNPAQHIAQVEYSVHDLPDYNGGMVKLYGLDGRLLAERKAVDPEGVVAFDLSGLASGTYVVVFLSEGHRVGQEILIKQ